jgi:2-oxoglutarate-Fe(II)-dependent oxygenase superfamily protein
MHGIRMYQEPFPHGTVEKVYAAPDAALLRDWIAQSSTWRECDAADPPRRGIFFDSEHVLPGLDAVLSRDFLDGLHAQIEEIFGVRLKPRFTISANRYLPGEGIKIHNDFFPDPSHRHFFTHRLVTYLSADLEPDAGGKLGIFADDTAGSMVRVITPTLNSGSLMAMGPKSYHAVSTLRAGVRFSLVFSFCDTSGNYR